MRRALAPDPDRVFRGLRCVRHGALTTAEPFRDLIALRLAPSNLGCDLLPVAYRSVTFRIEATGREQVVAVADNRTSLLTFWSAGFTGGSSDDPVVRDPARSPVAAHGQLLSIAVAGWPRLAGQFVCPCPTAIHILLVDPR